MRALGGGLPVGPTNPSSSILRKWRFMTRLWSYGPIGRLLARLIRANIRRAYGCYISPTSRVGSSVYLPHPVGIVVGDNAVVEDCVTIYQNVTIGRAKEHGVCPRIEAGATVFAGAVLIGDIVVGAGATVGANAVVRTSVPPKDVAVGVPARALGRSGEKTS